MCIVGLFPYTYLHGFFLVLLSEISSRLTSG
jgi:hypothetical protein